MIFFVCAEIEALEDEEEFPPLSHEKTKLEHLLEPTNFVPDEVETKEVEIDTLEAHAELIKRREQIKVELLAMKDQVRLKSDVFFFVFFFLHYTSIFVTAQSFLARR